jgi:hypothetical protein
MAALTPRWFIAVSFVFAALFVYAATLQLNDPDPARWLALYGFAAILSAFLPFRVYLRWPAIITASLAAAWCGYLLSHVVGVVGFSDLFSDMSQHGGPTWSGQANAWQRGLVEQAREAGGTAIVSLWLATAVTILRRIRR